MTKKYRQDVLDNYLLLIDLVKKKDSKSINPREVLFNFSEEIFEQKLQTTRKIMQLVRYMKKNIEPEQM